MEKIPINAAQLFLLCSLRKGQGVYATNIENYLWTCTHDNAYQAELSRRLKPSKTTTKWVSQAELIRQQIITEIPIEQPKLRRFIVHETDFGFSLCDADADASWYMPQMHKKNTWDYPGFFELQLPLSPVEKFLLFTFLKIDDDPLVK